MRVGREPADVPSIAHRDQRQDSDLGVLERMKRAEQPLERKGFPGSEPVAAASGLGQTVELAGAEQLDRLVQQRQK